MIPELRRSFNARFTDAAYQRYVQALEARCGAHVEFHLSETPCFLPATLIQRLVDVSQTFIDQLLNEPAYRRAADEVVPPEFRLAHGETTPTFVQVDFGLLE